MITSLCICSYRFATFDGLVRHILSDEKFRPMVCQLCGFIVAGEDHAVATDVSGGTKCPECMGDMVEAGPDTLNEAFDSHFPWRRCEHCDYYFLFDDDIGKEITDEYEPGMMGCPNCRKMT